MGATTVLEFLTKLLEFFGTLLAASQALLGMVMKLQGNSGGEKSENSVRVPASRNRKPSSLSVFIRNLKGLPPGKRFWGNASIGVILIISAVIGLFANQFIRFLVPMVRVTVNIIASISGTGSSAVENSAADQVVDPFLIPIAFLVVLGVLVLVLALAFFLAEAIFYIAAGVDIFYDEKSERLRLSKCGIACDVVSIAVLLFAASGKLPGDWSLLGPILFIALVVGFYNYFHYRRNKVADCSANTR